MQILLERFGDEPSRELQREGGIWGVFCLGGAKAEVEESLGLAMELGWAHPPRSPSPCSTDSRVDTY